MEDISGKVILWLYPCTKANSTLIIWKDGKKCRLTVKKNPKMMSQNQNIQNKAQNFLQMVKLNQICIVREVCVCEAFYSDFWQPTPPLFE